MIISTKEYDVLQQPIDQIFKGCKDNSNATLFVMQRDTRFLFIPIKKKYTEVRCNLTGKKIPKRKWNEQTKKAAKDLLAQHKVSKTGWYILMLILFITIGGFLYSIYSIVMSSPKFNNNFALKTATEKNILLAKLGEGDLIKTTDYVYKIQHISKKQVTVIKSTVANSANGKYSDPYSPIDESKLNFNKTTPININPSAFWEHQTINPKSEYGGELIMQILNK